MAADNIENIDAPGVGQIRRDPLEIDAFCLRRIEIKIEECEVIGLAVLGIEHVGRMIAAVAFNRAKSATSSGQGVQSRVEIHLT